jgi:outer membrane protein TolC
MVMLTAMRATAIMGAVTLLWSVQTSCAQESQQSPSPTDIPERYRRQVAPTPSTYWQAPALRDYTRVLKSTEAPLIDPNKRYELPELIDLAQRVNPETRVAWEAARRAALAVGLVESEYCPALASWRRVGRREGAPSREPRVQRKHQQIVFAVQRAYYGLTSVRARIAVAQSSLDAVASGSWGFPRRQRPSMAAYVAMTEARRRGDRRRMAFMLLTVPCQRLG